MIEGQGPFAVEGIGDDGRPGVVAAPGGPRGPGQEDRRDGVEARVPRGIRVGAELADERDLERRLFAGLADGGGFERLAVFDESPRERPARRRVLSLDEDDAAETPPFHDLDDDVDGGEGVPVFRAGHLRSGFQCHCRSRARELSIL